MKLFLMVFLLFIGSVSFAGSGIAVTTTQTLASVTTTAGLILAGDAQRSYLLIQNKGASNVTVKFKSAPASASDGVVIAPGGNYEPFKGVYDDVYAVSASGTNAITIIEGH